MSGTLISISSSLFSKAANSSTRIIGSAGARNVVTAENFLEINLKSSGPHVFRDEIP